MVEPSDVSQVLECGTRIRRGCTLRSINLNEETGSQDTHSTNDYTYNMLLNVLVLAVQLQIPAPQGFVNDFAGMIDSRLQQAMTTLITEVQQKTGGEIAVVTLQDLEGRASIDVARDIGRQWGVGAERRAGSQASNAGVVLLLVPGQRPGDGRADLAISTGRGAEGFITDAETLRIRDAIGEAAARSGSYAEGLSVGVQLLAREYAEEFGVTLTGQVARPIRQRQPSGRTGGSYGLLMLLAVFFIFGRRGSGRWLLLGMLLGGGRGGHYHGGGGFGGGGFGGFGGGGGFSGGGSSGSF